MIKLSASAVKGFVEECYRKGLNEQQTAYLMERSLETSDALLYKQAADDADEWEETTREEFFEKHPEAKEMYETPKYRKDPRYASFIDAMDKKTKIYSKKGNPYFFKWDPPAAEEKAAGYMGQYQNQMPQQQQPVQQQTNEQGIDPSQYQETDMRTVLKNNPEIQRDVLSNPVTRRDPQYTALYDAMAGRGKVYANRVNPRDIRFGR